MTASLRLPDLFEETLADLLRIKAEEGQGREEAGREEEGKGATVIRPAERTCPIHGGFLKQQSRRVEPPGMILQDPVPESLYGCPEEGCTFRLEVCPHDAEVLEYVDSGGVGGVYEPERLWTIEEKYIVSAAIDASGRSCGLSAI